MTCEIHDSYCVFCEEWRDTFWQHTTNRLLNNIELPKFNWKTYGYKIIMNKKGDVVFKPFGELDIYK